MLLIVVLDAIAEKTDTEAGARTIAIEIMTVTIIGEMLRRRVRVVVGAAVAGGVLQLGEPTARSPTALEDEAAGTSDTHKGLPAFWPYQLVARWSPVSVEPTPPSQAWAIVPPYSELVV